MVAQANPITYIATNPDLPAFSIAHGDADCNIPFQQSQLAQALVDAGEQPELTILPRPPTATPSSTRPCWPPRSKNAPPCSPGFGTSGPHVGARTGVPSEVQEDPRRSP